MVNSQAAYWARNRKRDFAQHGVIEPQIRAGALETAMAEDVSDRLHADAARKQPHRQCVPQAVDVVPLEPDLGLPSAPLEDVADRGALERPARAPRAQEQLGVGRALPQPIVLEVAVQDPTRGR